MGKRAHACAPPGETGPAGRGGQSKDAGGAGAVAAHAAQRAKLGPNKERSQLAKLNQKLSLKNLTTTE